MNTRFHEPCRFIGRTYPIPVGKSFKSGLYCGFPVIEPCIRSDERHVLLDVSQIPLDLSPAISTASSTSPRFVRSRRWTVSSSYA